MMTWIDGVGYLASALVLLTFCMSTMLSLRAIAICSNLAFVGYGLGAGIYPVLILHVILLPLNTMLLIQMAALLRKAKLAAATDLSPTWLQPFMRAKQFKVGETIFRRGDYADSMYMIVSGEVMLSEINRRLSPGELFGEIGLFSIERHRTASAVAATDVDSLWISGGDLKKLCERNPGLSLYFLRLTATRMTENAARALSASSDMRSTGAMKEAAN
jgi:CRP/FNR family cyclic AMP-dependent transcriptional regulator